MTFDELLAQGQRKAEENRQAVQAERDRRCAETERERRGQWDAVRAAVKTLVPACLHEFVEVPNQMESAPDVRQCIKIAAPGCVPVFCYVDWKNGPPVFLYNANGHAFSIQHHTLDHEFEFDFDPDAQFGVGGPAYVRTWREHGTRFADLDMALAAAHEEQRRVNDLQAQADASNAAFWQDVAHAQAEYKAEQRVAAPSGAPTPDPDAVTPIDYLEVAVDALAFDREEYHELHSIAAALVAICHELRAQRLNA